MRNKHMGGLPRRSDCGLADHGFHGWRFGEKEKSSK
jgi:hypothetical protein